ncbi:aldo/keto reductase [Pilimelia columellifera]|uniref:Aldo/keto reductase n=1 Tax=Pilimelia columellifera subsp. columellifera TaxID=706583 RepID=A0ABN3NR38_9ACTN
MTSTARILTGGMPWQPPPARRLAERTLRAAVAGGVQLIDTADSYALGANEEFIADILAPYPPELLIATKVGQCRPGPGQWVPLGRPEYLRQQAQLSLRRLRVDTLDLLQLHRLDPAVPLEDQVGTLAELRDQGLAREVGLSQVTVEELERACAITPIAAVQNKYSISHRDDAVLDWCAQRGITFLPWRPLEISDTDAPVLAEVAAQYNCSTTRVALAWLLHRSPALAPIPGTSRPEHLADNLGASVLHLDPVHLTLLDDQHPPNKQCAQPAAA